MARAVSDPRGLKGGRPTNKQRGLEAEESPSSRQVARSSQNRTASEKERWDDAREKEYRRKVKQACDEAMTTNVDNVKCDGSDTQALEICKKHIGDVYSGRREEFKGWILKDAICFPTYKQVRCIYCPPPPRVS
jgi:hypothetical protein